MLRLPCVAPTMAEFRHGSTISVAALDGVVDDGGLFARSQADDGKSHDALATLRLTQQCSCDCGIGERVRVQQMAGSSRCRAS